MHILILNWRDPKNPSSGGAEIVTMAHAKAWVKAGNRVTWFTSLFTGAPKVETLGGVTIVRHGGSNTVRLLAPFYYLFSGQIFDVVIDEIHGIPFFTPLYVRKPKIAFIHEVAGVIWDYMSVFPFNAVGKFIESFSFYFYRAVPWWTDAPSTIDDLVLHGIDRSKCVAIPCPPDNAPLSRLPQKESTPTLVFVSRIVPMKGVEEIIKAFALLPLSLRARLWIAGEGEAGYLKYLHNVAKNLNITSPNIRFFGKVSQSKKLELMGRAHVLVHASVKEGWGLVIVEAASQGTPAIVYNVAGLKDSVKNGQTGIVLAENSPTEMARQIVNLFRNRKQYKRFQGSCLRYTGNLSWKKVTSQSLTMLKEEIKNYEK